MSPTPKDTKPKQPNKISERDFDSVDSLFSNCGEKGKKVLKDLLFVVYKMGADYCNGLHNGKTITIAEASRMCGMSEYHIKQAILLKELDAKRVGSSKNASFKIKIEDFNLWRSLRNI